METPSDYLFTDEHEWAVREEDGTLRIGISYHAQDLLGDVVFVELPPEETELDQGAEFGVVESVKTASELYSPISGTVVAVNEDLHDTPELVNDEPYTGGWMVRLEPSDPDELDELMDADTYDEFVEEQE
jgi:glycine cleavage system H protein